eukprot:scaffold2876_cov46-Phaeocystis_antarctica.AAC.1
MADLRKTRPETNFAFEGPLRARRGFCSAARASHAYRAFPVGQGKGTATRGEQQRRLGGRAPPADLRKTRPETSFAFEGPCALGEASVRRRALPTRSLRFPRTGERALPPKEGSGGASRAATGPKGEISP